MFWLFTLFDLVIKVNSIVAKPTSNFNYTIGVQRDCDTDKIKREILVSTAVAANLSKSFTCNEIASEPDKIKIIMEQCNCPKDTTFVAVNRTCIGNNVLMKKYDK